MNLRIPLFITLTLLSFGLCSAREHTRRESRRTTTLTPVPLVTQKAQAVEVQYKVTSRTNALHRKAIYAFHRKQYATSEECFSLAFNNYPENAELVLDYALCSALYPEKFRSLTRSTALLNYFTTVGLSSKRLNLVSGIISYQKGEFTSFIQKLQTPSSGSYALLAKELLKRYHATQPLLSAHIFNTLFPLRTAPADRRNRS